MHVFHGASVRALSHDSQCSASRETKTASLQILLKSRLQPKSMGTDWAVV